MYRTLAALRFNQGRGGVKINFGLRNFIAVDSSTLGRQITDDASSFEKVGGKKVVGLE
jgi:hypothetical protein